MFSFYLFSCLLNFLKFAAINAWNFISSLYEWIVAFIDLINRLDIHHIYVGNFYFWKFYIKSDETFPWTLCSWWFFIVHLTQNTKNVNVLLVVSGSHPSLGIEAKIRAAQTASIIAWLNQSNSNWLACNLFVQILCFEHKIIVALSSFEEYYISNCRTRNVSAGTFDPLWHLTGRISTEESISLFFWK